MGYYIQGPNKGKANFLVETHGGQVVPRPASFNDIPAGKALIVVCDNGPFEAAGFAFSPQELKEFLDSPGDMRRKTCVLLDLQLAKQLSGFRG